MFRFEISCWVCSNLKKLNVPYKIPISVLALMMVQAFPCIVLLIITNPSSFIFFNSCISSAAIILLSAGVPMISVPFVFKSLTATGVLPINPLSALFNSSVAFCIVADVPDIISCCKCFLYCVVILLAGNLSYRSQSL